MNGFQNETRIINALNNNPFDQLSSDLQKSLCFMNGGVIPKSIRAKRQGGINKADISIFLDNVEKTVSVKKGTGNSVHQEPVEDFINFLKNNFEDNPSVFDDLRYFIWGDKTLDGSGSKFDRLGASQLKKRYPSKIKNIQSYFGKYKSNLLQRFLISGAVSNKSADYLLYGTVNTCTVVKSKDLLNFAVSQNKNPISIGVLTFQAWNRNLNRGTASEHKRGQIQLKWGDLKNDIKKI